MGLILEVQMETNRTWGSPYPGRARQGDDWIRAKLHRWRGKGLTAHLHRTRRWEVEVDGDGGSLIFSGYTGTNTYEMTFRPKDAQEKSA